MTPVLLALIAAVQSTVSVVVLAYVRVRTFTPGIVAVEAHSNGSAPAE